MNKINIGNDLSSEVGQILAFRSKHHILPFYSFEYFIWWIPGIVMLILYLFIILSISENEKLSKKIKLIITLVIIQLLLCLIISLFDKNYIIANFTPFRTSPILLLLIIYYFMFKLIKHDIGFKIRMAILVPLYYKYNLPSIRKNSF